MSVVKILQYPDVRLKRKAYPVNDFGPAFQKVVDDMCDTYFNAKNCAALAATQLDIEPAPHVTVVDYPPVRDQGLLCLVNGKIVAGEGEQNEEEGCMSVGCDVDISLHANVKRAEKITVIAQDRHGKKIELELTGYYAKCVQHELDHLEGKIFLDHLGPIKRERIEKKLLKELKRRAQ
jgi:peptide deformylase